MPKHSEMEWVGEVLHDVITFLAKNEMEQSARTLAVAAAPTDSDLSARCAPSSAEDEQTSNILSFRVHPERG
jgi:hypothetical protein